MNQLSTSRVFGVQKGILFRQHHFQNSQYLEYSPPNTLIIKTQFHSYMTENTKLLVGTKKGAFIVNKVNGSWEVSEPINLGNNIFHFLQDPRDGNKLLMATKTGHLGPTVYVSSDAGKSFREAEKPPRFESGDKAVEKVFWLSPGHSSEKDVWFCGTSPQGLFRSEDGGNTWHEFEKFNNNSDVLIWMENFGTPIGPLLHSILIDPEDKNHMLLAMSLGGSIETWDNGETWKPINKNVLADFQPEPYPDHGQCVHSMRISSRMDIIYQQNHCGIYRLDRRENASSEEWVRIGDNMPEDIGDIGFPMVVHPSDNSKIWVWPMDSSDVWPRTSKDGKPAVYHSSDYGDSWKRQDAGFPQKNAYFTVLRQAMCSDDNEKLGLFLGNTSGELWSSSNAGENWELMVKNLPDIYSVSIAR